MQGFSIIEVLIALIILSAGLLSISAAQILALRSTTSAYYQTIANQQTENMLEQLRANTTNTARQHELQRWNKENNNLLPQGKGNYYCEQSNCSVTLNWQTNKTHTIKMSTAISSYL